MSEKKFSDKTSAIALGTASLPFETEALRAALRSRR